MKKLFYLFVMVAGMTLLSVNVNADDTKVKEKPAAAACCKAGDKAGCAKSCDKAAVSCKDGEKAEGAKVCTKDAAACTKKDAPKK
jgi:hypothetical protein